KLVEESAGGIALEVAKGVCLTALEQLEVGIYSGWYVARVIHTRPIESGQRVGLQRIVAIAGSEDSTVHKRGSSNASGGMGKVAMFFVVAAALFAGAGLSTWFGDMLGKSSSKLPAR